MSNGQDTRRRTLGVHDAWTLPGEQLTGSARCESTGRVQNGAYRRVGPGETAL